MRTVMGASFLVGVTVVLASCAPHDPNFAPGTSDGPIPVDGPVRPVADEAKRWEHFDRVKDLDLLGTFRSRGHGTGTWDGELRGGPGVLEALRGDRMPEGTLMVQSHRRPGGDDAGLFVMEKREEGYFPAGGDWEYAVVGREGRIEARGKLESCARCHAEAEGDFVFVRSVRAFE